MHPPTNNDAMVKTNPPKKALTRMPMKVANLDWGTTPLFSTGFSSGGWRSCGVFMGCAGRRIMDNAKVPSKARKTCSFPVLPEAELSPSVAGEGCGQPLRRPAGRRQTERQLPGLTPRKSAKLHPRRNYYLRGCFVLRPCHFPGPLDCRVDNRISTRRPATGMGSRALHPCTFCV